jgi:tripartite-type tricarboxylate transporter receptor subunit TctC
MTQLVARFARAAWAAAVLWAGVGLAAPALAQMKQNWMYASSVPAHEQKPAFPIKDKAIRVVLAAAPGSSADAQARAVAPRLSELLGVPVELHHRPVGGALAAAQEVLQAMPDGHTVLFSASPTMTLAPHTLTAATFEPVNDFAQIGLSARSPPVLMVSVSLPVNSIAELIAYGKAHPGQLGYTSAGVGSASHILAAAFAMNTGVSMVHVPDAAGTGPAAALASGRVQLAFDAAPAALQLARSGRARLLAIAAPSRSPLRPELATFSEQGVNDIDVIDFFGWYAPGGVQPQTVATLHDAMARALQLAPVQALFKGEGLSAESSTPQELTAMVKGAHDAWGKLVSRVGIAKQ